MRAVAETARLPFSDRRSQEPASRVERDAVRDWFLALRHAQVPFHPDDRLLLLYGHPLVFRLGLYAATERVLAGESVLYLDGANTFDPFVIGRLARAHRQQPRKVLTMIHVARAFTCHQMERLVSDCLAAALDRYQARIAILSGLFDTFYDQAVPEQEALRLFGRMMEGVKHLTQQGYTLLCLCPPAPILTRTSRRCLDQLRGQADRVIRVHEEQGLVKLEEEGRQAGQTWEVARSVLEYR
ncbi:MAG TPA: hypothetical protein VLD60_05515 [Nitrospira sp.]|nr:hypothetical protein [Nitrospira sp.]